MLILNGKDVSLRRRPPLTLNGGTVVDYNGKLAILNGREVYNTVINGVEIPLPDNGVKLYFPGLPAQGLTIKDYSGNGNNGTITEAIWQRLSSGLWVLEFDGTNDLVAANGVAAADFFDGTHVMMVWAKLTAWANNRTIMSAGVVAASGHYSEIDFNTADKKFYARTNGASGANNVGSLSTYDNDSTYHLFAMAVNASGHILDFQIDEVSQGSDATNASAITVNAFYVGQLAYETPNTNPWKGQIGLPRVLSGTTIPKVFNSERHLFGV